jgi:hypothetical protein
MDLTTCIRCICLISDHYLDNHGLVCRFKPGYQKVMNPKSACPVSKFIRDSKGRIQKVWCQVDMIHQEHVGTHGDLEFVWKSPRPYLTGSVGNG